MSPRRSTTAHRRAASARCLPWLRGALVWLIAYAVAMLVKSVLGLGPSTLAMSVWWITVQLGLALAVGCLYRYQSRAWRWGAVAALLTASALLTLAAPEGLLLPGLQALGLAGFSLVLYDLGRLSGRRLQTPGGLIFLAVIAGYVLHTPLTAFIGLALLAVGATLALRQLL